MKKILFLHFVPVILSLCVFYYLVRTHKQTKLDHSKTIVLSDSVTIIPTFDSNPKLEASFLKFKEGKAGIHVLGSSELACEAPSVVHDFLPREIGINVTSVGREGNQSFSMYLQLLANRERLKNANIVFVISPVWFNFYASMGTRATVLLRYASDNFLNKIIQDDLIPSKYSTYAYKRIAETFEHDKFPQRLAVAQMANANPDTVTNVNEGINSILKSSVAQIDDFFYNYLMKDHSLIISEKTYKHSTITSVDKTVDWDSLFVNTRKKVAQSITTNDWGMDDSFYKERVNGEQSDIHMPANYQTKELDDFNMLVSLCEAENINASFIILPMNAYYFPTLDTLSPVVSLMEHKIAQSGFPCFNMWQTDTALYDKYILSDELHLSEYGWYVADKFISDTYKLLK